MGDGRYYTFFNFFSVNTLVIVSVGILASMLVTYYRNTRDHQTIEILKMFLILFSITILKTIELVIPSIEVAYKIRCFNAIAFVAVLMLFCNYFNINFIKGLKYNFNKIISGIILLMYIISFYTNGQLILTEYYFLNFRYSHIYLGVLMLLTFLILLFISRLIFLKGQIHNIYTNKTLSLLLMILMLFPLLIYNYMIMYNKNYIHFVEILIFITLSGVLNGMTYSQSQAGVTALVFDKIGDIINDYVFVTDAFGNIIYRNLSAKQSPLFKDDEVIKHGEVDKIFKVPIEIQKNDVITENLKLKLNNEYNYFTYKYKALRDEENVIGYIITIVDITELINIRDSLKDRKEKMKETNLELEKYSKVVYQIEKEKEISNLFEDIVSSNEKKMENLVHMIDSISSDDENFELKIVNIIKYNQRVLEDVRQAVSDYRDYYGG